MAFTSELEFEKALIEALKRKGWEDQVLNQPTEDDLIKNWANILFENNRGIDRLNDAPLTEGEMCQILDQITELRTPINLNAFINGKTVSIKRDNPLDPDHLGKEVSLKIYDRHEIAAGQSRYQIARQPIFKSKSAVLSDRRGDLMLLINGMPVIHVELKKSGVALSQAYNQIEKYSKEGLFRGIYSLIQIFVAMNPEETVYFSNPGPDGKFNKDFYFHWADFNNEPLNSWQDIAARLLSIPMAHQMIGFYTVADRSDGVLKVMRSYQYYAANAISDKVAKNDWESKNQHGGYIWHTTGSGKTMTSFKSAQLIANSKDADKVVFLMDRVELGTQSLYEYRAFADEREEVQATENTRELIAKLKSKDAGNTLIVTSIQKMSRIQVDEDGLNAHDIKEMNKKRIVFIIDEAHRSTFGDMLSDIKRTFPYAIFFGFTGTPIYEKNKKKNSTTAMIFGDELHRYTIADGIRDKNVLGFDPYKVSTYRDKDLRSSVALRKAGVVSEADVFKDERRKDVYYKYMDEVSMTGEYDEAGTYMSGIEDFVGSSQYNRDEHRAMVVEDIADNWITLSRNGKFHAIFATSSIPEAIKYYKLFKERLKNIKATVLVDSTIDNNGNEGDTGAIFKEENLAEILIDYNESYGMDFSMRTYDKFKKDVASRLAHKKPYERIENDPENQLDILIVVDQMLTGFDSKWVNTLYLDKVLKYENIIQAFSRTNRLFGPDKPFGVIRYYRYPNTMERNIEEAVKYYSGYRKVDLFVEHLPHNLRKMNEIATDIKDLFALYNIENYDRLPDDLTAKGRFAKLFAQFNSYFEAAKVQGFVWEKSEYIFDSGEIINMLVDEQTYAIWLNRYKELDRKNPGEEDLPFEIDGYLTQIDTDKIDSDYMNSRFQKYLKDLDQENISPEELQKNLNELHKSFASLSQEDQRLANIFLHDFERGNVKLVEGKSFRDYITDYKVSAKNKQISDLHMMIGVDEKLLAQAIEAKPSEKNLDEFGRFTELVASVDRDIAQKYLSEVSGKKLPAFKVSRDVSKLLRDFVLAGGFDILDGEGNIIKYK